MWTLHANFISVGPVTRTHAASSLVRNGVDIQGLAPPADFLGLVPVMPVGLEDVNIRHLAQYILLFKRVAHEIEPNAGAKRTLRLEEMVVRLGSYE